MDMDIQSIVEAWIDENFSHLEDEWDEAGGEEGGFQDMITDIVYDVSADVESDLEPMVQDNLDNSRHWEIATMIESRIAEIEREEEEVEA